MCLLLGVQIGCSRTEQARKPSASQHSPATAIALPETAATLPISASASRSPEGFVIVTDTTGRPIAGAEVRPVSASITGSAATTDEKGEATVPINNFVQPTQWVGVVKDGFRPVQVTRPYVWPLRITLTAESMAPESGQVGFP